MVRQSMRCGILFALAITVAIALEEWRAPAADAGDRTLLVRADATASIAPPMIAFRLRDEHGGLPLAARDDALADLIGDLPCLGVLDTGASAHLLSRATAERYGIAADRGARYVETGMTGEHPLAVSSPYTLALEGGTSDADDAGDDGRRRAPRQHTTRATPALLLRAQRLLLNDVATTVATMLTSPGAIVDVIGMPALTHTAAELRIADDALGAVAVTFAPSAADLAADAWVPLVLLDFNRRSHPTNHGALPTLAPNPVIRGVRTVHGAHSVRGDWLLDTGSAVTLVSTAAARALDLSGPPTASVPVGGISGSQQDLQGYQVERIELPTTDGRTLTLTDATIFIHDIITTRDDGTKVTLDGVVGMNLLLAFDKVVIDAPHARLGVDLRD